jgi:hypothetical protein
VGFQRVAINLNDEGFAPAILVVQRYVPAEWVIKIDSPDPGNKRLIFPAYYAQIDTEQGDNVFYGYVKVVDDITNINIGAIKAEAAAYETLIYPDAYFELAGQGAGCCR